MGTGSKGLGIMSIGNIDVLVFLFFYLHTYTGEKMSESNRSGYELRTDLLGMAIGIVTDKNNRQFDNEHLKPEGQRSPVPPYTTEDVIAEAEKLYQFVQKKN
jgi:reverse gyrase